MKNHGTATIYPPKSAHWPHYEADVVLSDGMSRGFGASPWDAIADALAGRINGGWGPIPAATVVASR